MQVRKTLQRHMESQARLDRAHGRMSSDEELAKNMALWRGAGFQGPCPGVPAVDEPATSRASRVDDIEPDDSGEEGQAPASGRGASGELPDDAGWVEDVVPREDEALVMPEEVLLDDAMVLQDEPVPDNGLPLGDELLLDDIIMGLDPHSEHSGEALGLDDSGIVIDDVGGSDYNRPGPGGILDDTQGLYDDHDDSRMVEDPEPWSGDDQDRAALQERPLSPHSLHGSRPPSEARSNTPGTPPSYEWSEVNARDLYQPLNDDFERDWDDNYFSEGSAEEPDEFFDFDDADDPTGPSGDPAPEEDDNSIPVDENDPLYARGEDLYGNDDDDDDAATFREDQLPPAFSEDALLRRAYVQAFVSATFHGTTKDGVSHYLTSMRSNYASIAERCPAARIPGLGKMAVTLRTVERRLGVDPDQRITYFFLCDKCWYRHHPSELYKLGHSSCAQPGCSGTLYDIKTLSDGKKRRRPTRILPTTSLKQELQRILLRPGKPAELNAWRQEHDEAGRKGPISQEDWPGSHDPNYRMEDMFDGWGWNAVKAGLQRRRGGRWEVEDVDVDDLQQRFVALPMGLILMFNIDWCVPIEALGRKAYDTFRFRGLKRGKYSVGAVYATICNNPRAKRFLLEETILVAIIPGPDEPSLEQLNSVLEPFVLEARELYSGKCIRQAFLSLHADYNAGSLMRLAGEKELSPVHVNVCILASDLPASRKTTGLKGHTSTLFMCPVCKKPFHSLVDEKCYDPESASHSCTLC